MITDETYDQLMDTFDNVEQEEFFEVSTFMYFQKRSERIHLHSAQNVSFTFCNNCNGIILSIEKFATKMFYL